MLFERFEFDFNFWTSDATVLEFDLLPMLATGQCIRRHILLEDIGVGAKRASGDGAMLFLCALALYLATADNKGYNYNLYVLSRAQLA